MYVQTLHRGLAGGHSLTTQSLGSGWVTFTWTRPDESVKESCVYEGRVTQLILRQWHRKAVKEIQRKLHATTGRPHCNVCPTAN